MKWSKELLAKPCHWHNLKYPFISYLQLFTQEGLAEPEEAHGASSDARPRTPGAEGQWEEPNRCVPWTQTYMNSTGAVLGMLLPEKGCFKSTGPYTSIAKLEGLAKISEKYTFQKFRWNLYILNHSFQMYLRAPQNYY